MSAIDDRACSAPHGDRQLRADRGRAADAWWGAQTERSLRFFAIGDQRMPLQLVHAMAQVKRAAAEVNGELGLLMPD